MTIQTSMRLDSPRCSNCCSRCDMKRQLHISSEPDTSTATCCRQQQRGAGRGCKDTRQQGRVVSKDMWALLRVAVCKFTALEHQGEGWLGTTWVQHAAPGSPSLYQALA